MPLLIPASLLRLFWLRSGSAWCGSPGHRRSGSPWRPWSLRVLTGRRRSGRGVDRRRAGRGPPSPGRSAAGRWLSGRPGRRLGSAGSLGRSARRSGRRRRVQRPQPRRRWRQSSGGPEGVHGRRTSRPVRRDSAGGSPLVAVGDLPLPVAGRRRCGVDAAPLPRPRRARAPLTGSPSTATPVAFRMPSMMSAFLVRVLVFTTAPVRWRGARRAPCSPTPSARAAVRQSSASSFQHVRHRQVGWTPTARDSGVGKAASTLADATPASHRSRRRVGHRNRSATAPEATGGDDGPMYRARTVGGSNRWHRERTGAGHDTGQQPGRHGGRRAGATTGRLRATARRARRPGRRRPPSGPRSG